MPHVMRRFSHPLYLLSG